MCQGCLSSKPLKDSKCKTFNTSLLRCMIRFTRPSRLCQFLGLFSDCYPNPAEKQPDQSQRHGSACKSQRSHAFLSVPGPTLSPAKTVCVPILHFPPPISHWQQKRKELPPVTGWASLGDSSRRLCHQAGRTSCAPPGRPHHSRVKNTGVMPGSFTICSSAHRELLPNSSSCQ